MKQLYFTLMIVSIIFILGCSNSEECHVVPNDDIASYLKLMPADSLDMSNPTGNKKLSDEIEEQMPLVKI